MKPGRIATALAALATVAALAACSSASTGGGVTADHSTAAAVANSVLAQPTVSNDLNQGEQLLQSNLQSHWNPAHPKKSVEAALRATFPHGDTGKIVTYGLKHFTLAVWTTSGPGSARDDWLQAVYQYALTQGGLSPPAGASTSPSASPAGSTA